MEPVERYIASNDWITALLLLGLIALVFARSMFYSRFENFIILPFNNKYVVLYNKKGRLLSGFHIAMCVFQLLNLALFAYLAGLAFDGEMRWGTRFIFPVILGGLLVFTLLKVGAQLLAGYLFESEQLAASMVFSKLSYLNYSALILFAANLLLTYLTPQSQVVAGIGLFLLITINAIGWISVLKIHQKVIASQFFYFILYLCALEISPFLIISGLLKA
ncbi:MULTISPECIES: DUF4271 domain-containing protein [Robiginitalea]|uniref:DUF4271 domain-containing protein n=1 Tax=Robiginitalea biformata (strain ATCC BAA-864 / DSM 15991 / KCTC 12146 / HTCC2501) TaxID=313596 RepID=A4CIZ1_ROBBH|nr:MULTISPECIES: DUF4271 domain-containing protein [Robiginitalea]EAR16899.1 hypothetical protein RB2501_08355 [Robiginitalea biformata HTCC2501]MDC6352897.1 DUF4271 domain-containing protein [Robiginitalea sp. PM2]MDC6373936.1 DUF4271 domain-containing protein [Robiginitalea sp. SP8]